MHCVVGKLRFQVKIFQINLPHFGNSILWNGQLTLLRWFFVLYSNLSHPLINTILFSYFNLWITFVWLKTVILFFRVFIYLLLKFVHTVAIFDPLQIVVSARIFFLRRKLLDILFILAYLGNILLRKACIVRCININWCPLILCSNLLLSIADDLLCLANFLFDDCLQPSFLRWFWCNQMIYIDYALHWKHSYSIIYDSSINIMTSCVCWCKRTPFNISQIAYCDLF